MSRGEKSRTTYFLSRLLLSPLGLRCTSSLNPGVSKYISLRIYIC